jgi:hypothetical protein
MKIVIMGLFIGSLTYREKHHGSEKEKRWNKEEEVSFKQKPGGLYLPWFFYIFLIISDFK